jgi:hypothetical protein
MLHKQELMEVNSASKMTEFEGHWMHSDRSTVSEYFPMGQLTHVDIPVMFLYFPDSQAVQTPPSYPEYPVLHLQLFAPRQPLHVEPEFAKHAKHVATLVIPSVKRVNVPTGQSVHSTVPDVFVYFPVGQLKHWKSLIGCRYVPTGQAWHVYTWLP